MTLGIAFLGGIFAGAITSMDFFEPLNPELFFDDEAHWTETDILPSTNENKLENMISEAKTTLK